MYHETFIGRVVSVKDPEKAGRVQIRIYGLHDDTTRLPDNDLPWARCIFPVTNPVHEGMSGGTTGLVVNSTIVGYFADREKQIPLVTGTLGSSSSDKSDFPKADRGEDHNDVIQKSLPSIGASEAKYLVEKTIGSIVFNGQEIRNLLQEVKSGNIIDAIHHGLSTIRSFSDLKNNLLNSTIGNLNNMVQGFVSDIGHGVEQTIGSVVDTTGVGSVIQSVTDTSSVLAPLSDTINHLAGNIATRTSKLPITNISDALNRLSGHRFVMSNVMPNLESSLNKLLEI